MGSTTKIEWCDATWSPWIGCDKVSEACRFCYAEAGQKRWGQDFNKIRRTSDKTFYAPMKWKESKKIFVCSWSDFYHPDVPKAWREEALNIMERESRHTFILLTKRPENIQDFGWPHVWQGVTVENQEQADKRIPILLAKARLSPTIFLSIEPMLGPIDLWTPRYKLPDGGLGSAFAWGKGVNWVIVGGESGPHARPINISWVRRLKDECEAAKVPFFFKQWGEWKGVTRDVQARMRLQNDPQYYLWPDEGEESPVSIRIGKKQAGSELDGKLHKAFPGGNDEAVRDNIQEGERLVGSSGSTGPA